MTEWFSEFPRLIDYYLYLFTEPHRAVYWENSAKINRTNQNICDQDCNSRLKKIISVVAQRATEEPTNRLNTQHSRRYRAPALKLLLVGDEMAKKPCPSAHSVISWPESVYLNLFLVFRSLSLYRPSSVFT